MIRKLSFLPGVDRERTRYANEGGWYESDKIRFREGDPQKIGGWQRLSSKTFLGVCRSMINWATLQGQNLVSVGTHKKYYIERGGDYYDITPIRDSSSLTDPFNTTNGSSTVLVDDVAHGALNGDFVTFSGSSAVGGLDLDGEYTITVIDADSYTIEADSPATSTVAGGGGSVTADYQIHPGSEIAVPFTGWSAGLFGVGLFGVGGVTLQQLRLWSQSNFGEDLIFAYRGGEIYLWSASLTVDVRGELVSAIAGASDVPEKVNFILVSDVSRFVLAFGATDYSSSVLDPMLIRWSDQENPINWTPAATNQAGSLRLSSGTQIVCGIQARQEILVWTDSALYGLQFLGAPDVWGASLLGDNITIASQNAAVYSGSTAYWMGKDRFYVYDGSVKQLPCSLRSYVFDDFNTAQYEQVIAGTLERFDEVWWFYCSTGSNQINRYVVYNYVQNIWYHGDLQRSAWLDADLRNVPLAATYNNNLVQHEVGVDSDETGTPVPITAKLTSAQFDLEDGDQFMLVRRILPDFSFEGSTADAPALNLTMLPMVNSGSGYTAPPSQGGDNVQSVVRSATVPIEQFSGQVFIRVRGRQMTLELESTALGVTWKMGALRLDAQPDGRRG